MNLSELSHRYDLVGALLIYALAGNDPAVSGDRLVSEHYFQFHRACTGPDGHPALLEGRPLTDDALTTLCREVLPGLITPTGFLDGRILAWSGRLDGPLVWWAPPTQRATFFAPETGIPNGITAWPGLVMAAARRELQVFALQRAERPDPDTLLYRLPLPNLDQHEQVCLGDAPIPRRVHPQTRERWERAFFDTAFSLHHPEHAQAALHTGTWQDLWRTLIRKRGQTFPAEVLRPHPHRWTVNRLLYSIGVNSTHSTG